MATGSPLALLRCATTPPAFIVCSLRDATGWSATITSIPPLHECCPGKGIRGAARFQWTVAPASPRVIATEAGNELRRLGSRRQPKMRSNVRVGLRAVDFTRAANGSLGRGFPFRGAGGKVRNRRISPVAAHSGDRLLSEPTAGTQPCWREPLFMPLTRHSSHCRPAGRSGVGGREPRALRLTQTR